MVMYFEYSNTKKILFLKLVKYFILLALAQWMTNNTFHVNKINHFRLTNFTTPHAEMGTNT